MSEKIKNLHNYSNGDISAMSIDLLSDAAKALQDMPLEQLIQFDNEGRRIKERLFAIRLIVERKLLDIMTNDRAASFSGTGKIYGVKLDGDTD